MYVVNDLAVRAILNCICPDRSGGPPGPLLLVGKSSTCVAGNVVTVMR